MTEPRSIRALVARSREIDADTLAGELGEIVFVGEIEEKPARPDGWGSVTEPGSSSLMLNPLGSLLSASCIAPGRAALPCIGRDEARVMRIPHPSLSALHARLAQAPDGTIWLRDEGSNNGTFVDGTRVTAGERVELTPGREVRFGDVTLRVYDTRQLHRILSGFTLK